MTLGYDAAVRENDLLQHVYAANAALPAGVTIPPGDDMGALRLREGSGDTVLVTVDQLADGVHVDLATASLQQVGRKAITRNLSDVAAMAARPVGAVVAASLPRGFGHGRAATLFDAMRDTAAAYACPLVGGDISIWDGRLLLTVTVLAEPWPGVEPVRRGTASVGDAVYVSGELGYSPAGHHLDFEPRLALARALAGLKGARPTAMMDLSDGLAMDLPRMMGHAEVEAALLPIRDHAGGGGKALAEWRHAVSDGEDYELLFTVAPGSAVPPTLEGVRLTRVGTVTNAGGVVLVHPDGTRTDLAGLGWEHGA